MSLLSILLLFSSISLFFLFFHFNPININCYSIWNRFVLSNGVDKAEYETKKSHFFWPSDEAISIPLRPGIEEATITVFESGVQKVLLLKEGKKKKYDFFDVI